MNKSSFLQMLGEIPLVKVIDFLIDNYTFDYSKTEVAREIGIGRVTIEPIWQSMIKDDIIIRTKNIGNASLYKLNIKNPIVIKLRELDLMLINKSAVSTSGGSKRK